MTKKELFVNISYGTHRQTTCLLLGCEASLDEKDAFVEKVTEIVNEMFPE